MKRQWSFFLVVACLLSFASSAWSADIYIRPIQLLKQHIKNQKYDKCISDGAKNIALFESRTKNKSDAEQFLVDATFLNELYVIRDFCFESLPKKTRVGFKKKAMVHLSDRDFFLGRGLVALHNNLGSIGLREKFERYLSQRLSASVLKSSAELPPAAILNYLKFTMRLDECFEYYKKTRLDHLSGSYCGFLRTQIKGDSLYRSLRKKGDERDLNDALLEISQSIFSIQKAKQDPSIIENIKRIEQTNPTYRAAMALERLKYFGYLGQDAEVVRILNTFPINQDGEALLAIHSLAFLGIGNLQSSRWCGKVAEVYMRSKSQTVLARIIQQAVWVVRCERYASVQAVQFARNHLKQTLLLMAPNSLLYLIAKAALDQKSGLVGSAATQNFSLQLKNFLKLYGVESK